MLQSRIVCACLVMFAGQLRADGDDTKKYRALIVEEAGGLVAQVDLGSLETGTKLQATIELVNNLPEALPILKMQTSCNCIKLHSKENEIPPNSSLSLDLELNVAKDSKSDSQILLFSMFYSEERAISVYLRYQIAGLVSFRNAVSFHAKAAYEAKDHQFRIPVLVTEPVALENLEINLSGDLRQSNAEAKMVEEDGTQYLFCRVPINDEKSKLGEITLRDTVTGRSASITTVIEISSGVSLAPRLLRFSEKRSDENEDEIAFEASAIVRLDPTLIEYRDADKVHELPLLMTWSPEKGDISHTSTRLAPGLYRVTLTWMPRSKNTIEDELPDQVLARFRTGNTSVRKSVGMSFAKL